MEMHEAWRHFAEYIGVDDEKLRAAFFAGYVAGSQHVYEAARETHRAACDRLRQTVTAEAEGERQPPEKVVKQ